MHDEQTGSIDATAVGTDNRRRRSKQRGRRSVGHGGAGSPGNTAERKGTAHRDLWLTCLRISNGSSIAELLSIDREVDVEVNPLYFGD